jgi:hypothetical protein
MFVRIFDIQSNSYFKSEVYAVINSGWYEKQLVVFFSDSGSYLKFFDYLDKSDPKNPKAMINSIFSGVSRSDFEWIYKRTDSVDKQLEDYAELLSDDVRFFEYRGYSWIYDDKKLLAELLQGGVVSTKGFESKILDSDAHKLKGWNYIETQQDTDFFLEQTISLHDSELKELTYVSGSYVDENNSMHCTDSERRVTMIFESQWCRPVEMVFEGVTKLNLRPSSDNYTSNVYGATLLLHNTAVFFCDDALEDIDESYDGTWVKAYNLRWRFL